MRNHHPSYLSAEAVAHPNIALIKYWGNSDNRLRLPANGSISLNLHELETRTEVVLDSGLEADVLYINDEIQSGSALSRVKVFLDDIRIICGKTRFLKISSQNNFPSSAGIASSASAFAALAAAASCVYGMDLSEKHLSRLARRGSGSACRSIPDGITEWFAGTSDLDSYAVSIAPPEHWDLWDCIAITQSKPKKIGSTAGHQIAQSSPLQEARIADTPRRLDICRSAISQKDFDKLADITELDSNMLHAIMLTSEPPLMYWNAASIEIMHHVNHLRSKGVPCAYTLDAGPNVHIICLQTALKRLRKEIPEIKGLESMITSGIGEGVRLLRTPDDN